MGGQETMGEPPEANVMAEPVRAGLGARSLPTMTVPAGLTGAGLVAWSLLLGWIAGPCEAGLVAWRLPLSLAMEPAGPTGAGLVAWCLLLSWIAGPCGAGLVAWRLPLSSVVPCGAGLVAWSLPPVICVALT